jgi:3-oxoacyl-(acyl-carrier-protein) synthase III
VTVEGVLPSTAPEVSDLMITRANASGGARPLGLGVYRPTRVVGNEEVCAPLDVDADWVFARSGIRTRRFAGDDETLVAMASAAARDALAVAGIDAAEIGVVLVATMSADAVAPQVSTRVAHEIGAVHGPGIDVGGACAGFCYGLELATALVCAGTARHVLLIGAERMTDIIDPADRSTAFLFGDGAGAVVVSADPEPTAAKRSSSSSVRRGGKPCGSAACRRCGCRGRRCSGGRPRGWCRWPARR